MPSYQPYASLFFELGMLKLIPRSGWSLLGVHNPESVAEHSLRAAQIGYILAKLEAYDQPEQVASMLIFHDIGECRTSDLHKVANRYVTSDEKKAVADQMKPLENIGVELCKLWNEMEQQHTTAATIAKDADLLEMIVTAIELNKRHGVMTEDWIENAKTRLKTTTAKKLLSALENIDINSWWKTLKKI